MFLLPILAIFFLITHSIQAIEEKKQVRYNADQTISATTDYIQVFGKNRYQQGITSYEKSTQYYLDGHYDTCIEELNIFAQLYPRHPYLIKALSLLSKVYQKNNELEKSIHIDMKIYRETPTTEDGLIAYLNAGKKSVSVGKFQKGRKILETVKNQMYSSKLAKDAEIEIRQLQILHPNIFPKPIASEKPAVEEEEKR